MAAVFSFFIVSVAAIVTVVSFIIGCVALGEAESPWRSTKPMPIRRQKLVWFLVLISSATARYLDLLPALATDTALAATIVAAVAFAIGVLTPVWRERLAWSLVLLMSFALAQFFYSDPDMIRTALVVAIAAVAAFIIGIFWQGKLAWLLVFLISFAIAYWLYWIPALVGDSDLDQYAAWSLLSIVPWFLAGACASSTALLLQHFLRRRKATHDQRSAL